MKYPVHFTDLASATPSTQGSYSKSAASGALFSLSEMNSDDDEISFV